MELSAQEWWFIAEYIVDGKPAEALKRTGYVGKFAREEAYRMLRKKAIADEIAKIVAIAKEKVQLNTTLVMEDITAVLTADPRDLYEIKRGACRHCYGEDFLYQRTLNEYRHDEFAANAKSLWFDPKGGIGYNPNHDPNPECPECWGAGELREEIKDVRTLSKEVAALYLGGKTGKYGIEVNMRSKDAAREAAARYLGMNKETVNVKHGKLSEMSDEQLEALARGELK